MFQKFKQWATDKTGIGGTGEDEADGEDSFSSVVCAVGDLNDGEMRTVEVDGGKVLLVKDAGEYHAIGSKCTHYGAPLEKGSLCNSRVRCPWHGACFNVKNGDIEDFPGLDSVATYNVDVSGEEVRVWGKKSSLQGPRSLQKCSATSDDERTFLIVGGGGAGEACVECLRQEGFSGRITMLTQEPYLPIDRTKLSKMLEAESSKLQLRKGDFYKEHCVDVKTSKKVTAVDTNNKNVTCEDGDVINYTKLFIATGGSPRPLGIPGEDLKNICYLRSIEDGNYIAKEAGGKNIVVIGTSFIGLEVAAYIQTKSEPTSVTVVGRSAVPLKQVLGEAVGVVVKKLLEEKGVKFMFNNPPVEFRGEGGALREVVLKDGTSLPADLCVVGVGVFPNTKFLEGTPIKCTAAGHVQVNKCMQTSVPDVYAAGDIVEFPLAMADDKPANIQHWQMANMHGRQAAFNMLDQTREVNSVPFFWTMILGKSIRYAGYGAGHDDIVIHGNVDDLKFVAFYTKGDRVVAVSSMNYDPIVAQAADAFLNKIPLTKQEVQASPTDWIKKLVNVSSP